MQGLFAQMQYWAEFLGPNKFLQALAIATVFILVGKLADLVILNGNPARDIAATLEVYTTIKNGVVYPIDELLKRPAP